MKSPQKWDELNGEYSHCNHTLVILSTYELWWKVQQQLYFDHDSVKIMTHGYFLLWMTKSIQLTQVLGQNHLSTHQQRCNHAHALVYYASNRYPMMFCWCLLCIATIPCHQLVIHSWWRHQMETFSTLLALFAGNSPVTGEFPHKGQWRGALIFSLIYAWTNGRTIHRDAVYLRRHRADYDVAIWKTPLW